MNISGANAEVSASPSTLQFQEGENEKSVDLNIQATGSGGFTISSVSVQKTFPDNTSSSDPVDSVNISVPGGGSTTLPRTLSLSSFDKAFALGGSQSGSLTVTYRLQGSDSYGNPIEAEVDIPVTVSAALPSDLQISSVQVELPDSPYYAGDQIENARVVVQATGSGQITGQILLDDESDWSEESSFSVEIDGETTFDIAGELPTDDPGDHTVTAEITTPVAISGSADYTISDQTPPFPPQTLTLVEDVAELTDLDGQAVVTSNQSAGYQEFTFNGTAKMKLLSLENTEISDVTVTDLRVQYANDKPTVAKIKGGTVEKEAEEDETFVTVANDYLKVKKVRFDGQDTSKILVDAKLAVPKLDNKEILDIEGLVVTSGGVEGKSFSYPASDPKSFNAFGMEFGIHDVKKTSKALIFAEDEANDRYSFSMSGSITMESKKGSSTKKDTLTTFQNLTFFSDGEIDGVISFTNSFDLVPDKLELNKIELKNEGSSWKLKLTGKLKNLPDPLDVANNTEFKISFDKDGNASGGVVAVKELENDKKGHKLGGSDDSEYDLGIGTLDLTYLAVVFEYEDGVFNKDYSEIRLGVDFYLDVQGENGGESSDDEKRVSFGELNANGDFEGGVRLDMEGNFDWHNPTNAEVLQDKQLTLPGMNLGMDSIAIQSEPFGIAITGSIVMGMDGVSGGINFENLILTADGTISNLSDAIQGGQFEVADSMQVEVGDVDWSTSPTDLSFESNETTGEGADQAPQKGEKTISVESYVRITDATVNIGDSDNPSLSGGFDEFTFYDPVNGGRSFVLRRAQLETSDVEIMADVEYSAQLLTLAGSMTIPGDTIEAAVVGKFGRQDGEFTMGVFVAATGLNMAVAPGVFLDGIGGGLFVNPLQDDMELVRSIAGFKRPELDGEITEKRPGGEENPGNFALMLLGEFYIAEKNMLSGRALLTLTANYFNIDAEASYAAKTVEGVGYLAVGWDPAYAEGNIELELDYFKILKGEGNLSFYVYGQDTWGVAGEYNMYMYDKEYGEISSGELFIGPPGLMVDVTVSHGMDLKVVKGKITFEGMFWFWQQAASSRFGVYASVTAHGEILKIASGTAKLEGALIAAPSLMIYSVGSVKLEILYTTVFKGSMWVSAGMNGFDGDRGSNSAYDQMIADARNMADAMESAKDELMDDLRDAQLELLQLSPEQLEAAGMALVEADSGLFATWQQAYQNSEISRWPGGMPQALELIRSNIFGPEAAQMAAVRSQLQSRQAVIASSFEQLNQVQEEVLANFENYEDLILEDLPSIASLGMGGSPFGGYDTQTVQVNGESKTIKVGFDLDISKAEQQAQSLSSIREDFAEYQDAFIAQGGAIDATLRDLDRILYNDQNNLSQLNTAYTQQYLRINTYLQDYIQHQIEQRDYAETRRDAIIQGVSDLKGTNQYLLPYMESLQDQVLTEISDSERDDWIDAREHIIDLLLQAGGEEALNLEQDYDQLSPEENFRERGVALWWEIPTAGFLALQNACDERLDSLSGVFGSSMQEFRNTWSQATLLVDEIYERKADLYAVLHEIYDQLARYGSGEIAVLGDGNAAGFGGLAGTGLGFRSTAAAATISAEAVSLPASEVPTGPTIGPMRPPVRSTGQDSVVSSSASGSRADFEAAAISGLSSSSSLGFFGTSVPSQQSGGSGSVFSGSLGGAFSGDGVRSGSSTAGSAGAATYSGPSAQGKIETTVDPADWQWVAVSSYFSAKRGEIGPYIENPIFQNYTGSIRSSNQYSAVLEAEFEAEHPVGVVEYSWSLSPHDSDTSGEEPQESSVQSLFIVQSGDLETNTAFLTSGNGGNTKSGGESMTGGSSGGARDSGGSQESSEGGGLFSGLFGTPVQTEIRAYFYIPWFSIGSRTSLEDTLLAGDFDPDTYALTIRARGAGGSSSIREGRLNLDFYDPAGDEGIYESAIDSNDYSPPSVPVVTVQSECIASSEALYASWSSSDSESGIQKYEYAVLPYSAVQETAAVDSVAPMEAGLNQVDLPAAIDQEEPFAELDWQNAGSLTEMNIRGLELEHGKTYLLRVRATNGAGRMNVGRSDPFMVDLTPPEAAEIASFKQESADGRANSFAIQIGAPADPESGISACQFALGSAEGEDDLFSWTPVASVPEFSGLKSFRLVDTAVSDGQEVYLSVRSVNRAGIASDSTDSVIVEFDDSSPPIAAELSLLPERYSIDTQYMQIGWATSEDPESGVRSYEYGIGTTANSPDEKWWTAVDREESAYLIGSEKDERYYAESSGSPLSGKTSGPVDARTGSSGESLLYDRMLQKGELDARYMIELTDLQLEQGGDYYAFVRVTNGAGLSTVSVAGPLTIDTSPPAFAELTLLSVDEKAGSLTVELTARDPESGIQAYRSGIGWTDISTAGTSRLWSTQLSLPIPEQSFSSFGPLIQIQVMNGAGLTAPAVLEALE